MWQVTLTRMHAHSPAEMAQLMAGTDQPCGEGEQQQGESAGTSQRLPTRAPRTLQATRQEGGCCPLRAARPCPVVPAEAPPPEASSHPMGPHPVCHVAAEAPPPEAAVDESDAPPRPHSLAAAFGGEAAAVGKEGWWRIVESLRGHLNLNKQVRAGREDARMGAPV